MVGVINWPYIPTYQRWSVLEFSIYFLTFTLRFSFYCYFLNPIFSWCNMWSVQTGNPWQLCTQLFDEVCFLRKPLCTGKKAHFDWRIAYHRITQFSSAFWLVGFDVYGRPPKGILLQHVNYTWIRHTTLMAEEIKTNYHYVSRFWYGLTSSSNVTEMVANCFELSTA